MSEREPMHLSPAQIMQTAGGESAGPETAQHLKECEQCRDEVEAWREGLNELSPLREARQGRAGVCPTPEELATYAAGLGGETSGRILDHLSQCLECAEIVRDALEAEEREALPALRSSSRTWQKGLAVQMAAAGTPPRRQTHVYWYAAAAALTLISTGLWWNLRQAAEPERLLAKAYTAARPFEYRLPDNGHGQLTQERGAGSTSNQPLALEAETAVLEAKTALQSRLGSNPNDAKALALRGRAALLDRNDYEGAITFLQRSLEAAPGDSETLTDLGCALAIRGDFERKAGDFPAAIDAFRKSLAKKPSDGRTLFNLALVYTRMSMVTEAIDTWNQFLATRPEAGWAAEANHYLGELEKTRTHKQALDRVIEDPKEFVGFARSHAAIDPPFDSEQYQDIFWKQWLPGLASREEARIAAGIEADEFRRRHGDGLLAAAAREAADARLQPAFLDVAHAIAWNQTGETDAARKAAERAVGLIRFVNPEGASRTAGVLRAEAEIAYATRKASLHKECIEAANLAIGPAERLGYLWVAGQAHLEHALCLDGEAASGTVRAEIVKAQTVSEQAKLTLLGLRARGFTTGIDRLNGNYGPIWQNAVDGLKIYWTTGAWASRAQDFAFSMEVAAADLGLRDSAEVFFRSSVDYAQQFGNTVIEASNRIYFASFLGESGKHAEELEQLDRADILLRKIPAGPTRDYIVWDTGMKRAEAQIAAGKTQKASEELDALASDTARRGSDERMLFHQTRALGLVAMGRWNDADAEFRQAIELNQAKLASLHTWLERLAYLQSAAESYHNLTQIDLVQNKNPEGAYLTWRKFKGVADGRVEVTPAAYRSDSRLTLSYAILPAGVGVFSERNGQLHARMVSRRTEEVQAAVNTFVRLCADAHSDAAEIRERGHQLFQWLVEPELGGANDRGIDIRADSWLGSFPFGALTDSSGTWLAQAHALTMIAGPQDRATAGAAYTRTLTATIVSAPWTTAPGGVRLPLLSAAEAETADVASHFVNATVLSGASASADQVGARAAGTMLFHFAGHGWSNSGNGALMLPPGADGEPRFLTARDLARQDWTHCSLAVLSACLTATGEQHGAVNNESLVQALLSGGVRNVIAARWSIDSAATRALMAQFYDELETGSDPPEALAGAEAKVASMKEWSHPYFWAGFDIFGKDR